MVPLTYAITLADWTPNQDMIRMMLDCLHHQTCKLFDVVVADHHYKARRDFIKELSTKYSFNIYHIPIYPAPHVAKHYIDCSVFNIGWLFSDAARCIRYSEWRCLNPTLTETILNEPEESFIDFYFHNISETEDIWDRKTGKINWDYIPKFEETHHIMSTIDMNCYGNNTTNKNWWLQVNGYNEVNFNFFHWEDIDYNARCKNSKFHGIRIPNMMVRFTHPYGNESNRANRPCEIPFKTVCDSCAALMTYIHQYIGTPTHIEWGHLFKSRYQQVCSVKQNNKEWVVCKKCNFVIPLVDTEDIVQYLLRDASYTKSPINVSGSARNMEALSNDMKNKSLETKLEIYKTSWENKRYL